MNSSRSELVIFSFHYFDFLIFYLVFDDFEIQSVHSLPIISERLYSFELPGSNSFSHGFKKQVIIEMFYLFQKMASY